MRFSMTFLNVTQCLLFQSYFSAYYNKRPWLCLKRSHEQCFFFFVWEPLEFPFVLTQGFKTFVGHYHAPFLLHGRQSQFLLFAQISVSLIASQSSRSCTSNREQRFCINLAWLKTMSPLQLQFSQRELFQHTPQAPCYFSLGYVPILVWTRKKQAYLNQGAQFY